MGTVFHACCLLETTTFRFPIRMLPSAPVAAEKTSPESILILGGKATFRHRSVPVRPQIIVSQKPTTWPGFGPYN